MQPTASNTPNTQGDPSSVVRFRVDWWYRHESDTDQSVRDLWQMTTGAASADDITQEVADLRRQGYAVQRITVHTICPTCKGNARVCVKTYKRAPAKYADCKVCSGEGQVASINWQISEVSR